VSTFRVFEELNVSPPAEGPFVNTLPLDEERPSESPATADELARLDSARADLLRVHRALLAVERVRYEHAKGPIANNSALLQLVIADPWFEWLRPMAQLVLLIDERTSDKKAPLGSAESHELLVQSRALLRADSEGDAFQRLLFGAARISPTLADLLLQVAVRQSGPT
jgi:hypothetical protein